MKASTSIAFDGDAGAHIEVIAGSRGTWTITYIAGPDGIRTGGGIRLFRMDHKFWLGVVKQTDDPRAEDYCTVATDGDCTLDFTVPEYYKDLNIAQVTVREEPLCAGESITIRIGDTSLGAPPATVPPFSQRLSTISVLEDAEGTGEFVPLNDLTITVAPGPATKGRLVCPSVVEPGEQFELRVQMEDRNSNPWAAFTGPVSFCCDGPIDLPDAYTFTAADNGAHVFTGMARKPGVYRITMRTPEGFVDAVSNPILCEESPRTRVYWGDMHNHTREADGTDTIDFAYEFSRDASFLDFTAVSEHIANIPPDFPVPIHDKPAGDSGELFRACQRAAREHYEPGRLVTFLGYEYTPRAGSIPERPGDHCLWFLDDQHELAIDQDLVKLSEELANDDVLIIPHVGGGWTRWNFHCAPGTRPLAEIASMHEHSEWFVHDGLSKGFKVGICAMSDGHMGHPGRDMWARHGRSRCQKRCYSPQSGITACLAGELTRESIWEALTTRATYATTGERILLDFSVGGTPMGNEVQSSECPTFCIEVHGTDIIERIEIIRNDRLVLRREPSNLDDQFTWTDEAPHEGESFYYLRVTQRNNVFAWSSPIWVTVSEEIAVSDADEGLPAWNDSVWPPAQAPGEMAWLPEIEEYFKLRKLDGRFTDLVQIGLFEEPRGRYVLLRGRDGARDGRPVHIHYYLGFEDKRLYIALGWADFGQMSNM